MNAFTTSSWPIIAAEKIVGLAPLARQEFRNRLVAGMRRGIDARLPIAEAPVNRAARECGLTFDQFPQAFEIAMGDADRLPHQRRVLSWKHIARQRWGGGR